MTPSQDARRGSSYRDAGIDYDTLDAGKRDALTAALATSPLLAARGGLAMDASRGEPAFVFELGGRTFGFVLEGLGTKSMIARQVAQMGGGETGAGAAAFAAVAQDTVAAIVNDLVCVGALPLVVNAYFATGDSGWYRNEAWHAALVDGWRRACEAAGATWGGGESPSLPGLVGAEEIELAGCAIGAVPEGSRALLSDALAPGDEIVLVASSGLHANGSSLARMLANRLPDGYATALPSGRTFGEALLDPSAIYVRLVAELLAARMPVSYCSHITGHGLLKLMRPDRRLTYRIRELPPVPEVLQFMVAQAGMAAAEAYRTFNMGAGFAVYTGAGSGERVAGIARELGYDALLAGSVEDGPRQVVIEPVGVAYADADMDLTPRQGA